MPDMVNHLTAFFQRTRANHAKVKTGCNTCKIRHLKCDEEKPECFRCRGTGRKCDYLLVEGHDKCIDNGDSARISICRLGSIASSRISFDVPGSGRERRSFHYFRGRTVPDLSGHSQSELWNRLVLQFCHAEPAIRHALVALGAVHEIFKMSGDHAPSSAGNEGSIRQFSLQQYNRAISELRKHMSATGHQSVEVALICCLLFIYFDILSGYRASALCHLENGLNILRGWRARNVHSSSSNTWLPSSQSNIIEGYLIQLFCRLDIQASLLLDTRIPQSCTILPMGGNEVTEFTPTRFSGLADARIVLEKIANYLTYFIAKQRQNPDRFSDSIPSAIIIEQAKINARLRGWSQALDDLLIRRGATMSNNDLGAVILLKMHRKGISLVLTHAESPSERVSDRFTGDFADVVSLAELLLKSTGVTRFSKGPPIFALDLGVIAPLFMTATFCRDATVRRKAISLLYASARQEALLDGATVAKIAERGDARQDRAVPGGVLELRTKVRSD